MIKQTIFFNDLSDAAQRTLREKVRDRLIEDGTVELNGEESEEIFLDRLYKSIDHYINVRNHPVEYRL